MNAVSWLVLGVIVATVAAIVGAGIARRKKIVSPCGGNCGGNCAGCAFGGERRQNEKT